MALSTDPTLGQHDSNNYNLGRGVVMLALFDASNNPTTAFMDVGNATDFSMNLSEEVLEHESSRSGLKLVDATATLKKSTTGTLVLDEITPENLSYFLSGTIDETSLAANTAATTDPFTIGSSPGGKWFEILDSAGRRVYNVTTLVVKDKSTGLTTYVEGTDYDIDTTRGMLFIKNGGAIVSDAETALILTVTSAAGVRQDVRILQKTTIRAALLFKGENAQTGEKYEVRLHSCKIAADGDAALIGDAYMNLGLTFTVEESSFDTAAPYGWVRKFPTT